MISFFGNLLLGENNELKNRHLRIDANNKVAEEQSVALNTEEGGQKNELGGQKKWSDYLNSLSKSLILDEKSYRKH